MRPTAGHSGSRGAGQRNCGTSRHRRRGGLLPLLCCSCSRRQRWRKRMSAWPASPARFDVVPGEPVRLELTVQADSAAPVRMHVPADPLLVLRAVEKLPVQRTKEGVIVHKRVVLWQALEPGTVTMNAISVETQGRKIPVPRRSPSPSAIPAHDVCVSLDLVAAAAGAGRAAASGPTRRSPCRDWRCGGTCRRRAGSAGCAGFVCSARSRSRC